jgi:hypothetical protein
VHWSTEQGECDDEYIRWMSRGVLRRPPADAASAEEQQEPKEEDQA